MDHKEKTIAADIDPTVKGLEEEISEREARIAEKESEVSDLSIQIQDNKIAINLFLAEYNFKVGIIYVELDKTKLRIKEYKHRINLAQGKVLSEEDLSTIEEKVEETFNEERQKVNDLENEAAESSEEYERLTKEEDKRQTLDEEAQEELKKLYRELAKKFHPDLAKDDKQRERFHRIFADIIAAYKNSDIETLKKYMRQAEREERIAKETPEEKLARLKEDYKNILDVLAKLRGELEDLKASETYKLKEKVDQAKNEGRDLLQELAASIRAEIAENQKVLDELIAEYKKIIGDISH